MIRNSRLAAPPSERRALGVQPMLQEDPAAVPPVPAVRRRQPWQWRECLLATTPGHRRRMGVQVVLQPGEQEGEAAAGC